jgi:hypothetical protein
MSMLKRLIIHPFAFALFPIAALLAYNIVQVSPRVALRSVAISLSATLILVLLITLVTRQWRKSALISTSLLILFFSYGHVYEFLQAHPVFGFSLGRHRYLIILYCLVFALATWTILRRSFDLANFILAFNVIGLLLLVLPVYQIVNYTIRTSVGEHQLAEASPTTQTLIPGQPGNMPDIYFIVLDSYARQDILMTDFGFDNSAFLNQLESMGFYIADCGRSNNTSTHGSLAITLNMDNIIALREGLVAQGLSGDDDTPLIRQSLVRHMFSSIGYRTVAFESGYEWTRIRDADVYLKYTGSPYEMQVLQPFEAMLIRTTALLIWSDSTYKELPEYNQNPFSGVNTKFDDHINRQLFILEQLPRLASYPGPKFVFVHMEIPHPPYVFLPDGGIALDPLLYNAEMNRPADVAHFHEGYINEIQFINRQMPGILQTLISGSKVPPIIVLIGDTGPATENKFENLQAYYFPGEGVKNLYPTISLINTFRLVFNTYFGAHFELLPDVSYNGSGEVVPEHSPACIQ